VRSGAVHGPRRRCSLRASYRPPAYKAADFADSVAGAAEPAGPNRSDAPPSEFVALIGPEPGRIGPMISIELERIEALELLGMTLAHLNSAEVRGDLSPRVPLLMAIRDKLAIALREEP